MASVKTYIVNSCSHQTRVRLRKSYLVVQHVKDNVDNFEVVNVGTAITTAVIIIVDAAAATAAAISGFVVIVVVIIIVTVAVSTPAFTAD